MDIILVIVGIVIVISIWWKAKKFKARKRTIETCEQTIKLLLDNTEIKNKENIYNSVRKKTIGYILDHNIDAPSNMQADRLYNFIVQSIIEEAMLLGEDFSLKE